MSVKGRNIPVARELPLQGTQQIVAKRLVESQHNSASVTSLAEADAETLFAQLSALRRNNEGVTLTHLIIKATALCLKRHTRLNATMHENVISEYAVVNMAIAVSLSSGELQIVVIRDAEKKSIHEIADEAQRLETKARSGALSLKDVRGGTFTISNYGGLRHVIWSTPIITPGQCGILGIGRARPQLQIDPAHDNGNTVVRRVLPLSLTYDHRIVNGFPAGLFLDDLVDTIEDGVTSDE